ncbi:unnamed protein product, partial [marine sediment metagenome]
KRSMIFSLPAKDQMDFSFEANIAGDSRVVTLKVDYDQLKVLHDVVSTNVYNEFCDILNKLNERGLRSEGAIAIGRLLETPQGIHMQLRQIMETKLMMLQDSSIGRDNRQSELHSFAPTFTSTSFDHVGQSQQKVSKPEVLSRGRVVVHSMYNSLYTKLGIKQLTATSNLINQDHDLYLWSNPGCEGLLFSKRSEEVGKAIESIFNDFAVSQEEPIKSFNMFIERVKFCLSNQDVSKVVSV